MNPTANARLPCVVLEANPPQYGADFITRAADALALVQAVGRPGLQLHLDTACMMLAGDEIATTLAAAGKWLRHFHISDRDLAPIGGGEVPHERFAAALANAGYDRWASIEMREQPPFELENIACALDFALRVYA